MKKCYVRVGNRTLAAKQLGTSRSSPPSRRALPEYIPLRPIMTIFPTEGKREKYIPLPGCIYKAQGSLERELGEEGGMLLW